MCQHNGSLGLPAGDVHPGFPAGGHGNGTHVWLPYLTSACYPWTKVGWEGIIRVSLVSPFLVADPLIGIITAWAATCLHFQKTRLSISFNGCWCAPFGYRELIHVDPFNTVGFWYCLGDLSHCFLDIYNGRLKWNEGTSCCVNFKNCGLIYI